MKSLFAIPFIPVSRLMHSHRSAAAIILADQIRAATGEDLTIAMTLDLEVEDFNAFDRMYVYFGPEWTGKVNMFGGVGDFPYVENFKKFCSFKGEVFVVNLPSMPDLHTDLTDKIRIRQEKSLSVQPQWLQMDWDNLKRMQETAKPIYPNLMKLYPNMAAGDSHAISMYRPGWMNNSVPFSTLYGSLKKGLRSFVRPEGVPDSHKFEKIDLYFGNIDVRHHLCRQDDPIYAANKLARDYVSAAHTLGIEEKAEVCLWNVLPIENESRKVPQTGWYKGTPFYGSWELRDAVRRTFNETLAHQTAAYDIGHFMWTSPLENDLGELDFKYMEKPQSIHLSREFYPHWNGLDWTPLREKHKVDPKKSAGSSASLDGFLD